MFDRQIEKIGVGDDADQVVAINHRKRLKTTRPKQSCSLQRWPFGRDCRHTSSHHLRHRDVDIAQAELRFWQVFHTTCLAAKDIFPADHSHNFAVSVDDGKVMNVLHPHHHVCEVEIIVFLENLNRSCHEFSDRDCRHV